MHRGYVKIHRKMQGSVFYRKPEYLAVWIHLLLEATHKNHRQVVGSQIIELKPGQLITGRKAISLATGVSEMKCFRILKCLENVQQIEQQTFTKYSIISITNWNRYQIDEQQNEQQMNNKCTTNEQQMNTNKNVKKESLKHMSDYTIEFEEFWQVVPPRGRRCGKSETFKSWRKHVKENWQEVIRAMEAHCNCRDWQRDNGQYIPMATTWINQQRWTADIDEEVPAWKII